jgi:hypothetical protein
MEGKCYDKEILIFLISVKEKCFDGDEVFHVCVMPFTNNITFTIEINSVSVDPTYLYINNSFDLQCT